jgi:4-hydroxy-tetrahydrodipicolinate synthase
MTKKTDDGCPSELRDALSGPIPSLRTPFTKSGKIDFAGVRSQVDFLIAGKAKTIMITWGDSLHSVMTDSEVARLARAVVEHCQGRAKVIAADKMWTTNKAISYAKYCADLGADFLMLLPPDWAGQTTPDSLVEHFNQVSEHIPTMLVTAFFIQSGARAGSFRMDTIRALYNRVPGLISVKDDIVGDFGIDLCSMVHEKWAVISGGLMKNHMHQVPYGVDGYLSLFMSFKPEISHAYWQSIQDKNYENAWKLIREKEKPITDKWQSGIGGFNPMVHGIMELYGVCGRHLPKPYHTLTDAQMTELKDFMKSIDIY